MTQPESDQYFLPKGYRVNPVSTPDDVRAEAYWHPRRLRNALYYQYAVYIHCAKIISERRARSLIDVGCGVGRKLEMLNDRFPALEITGIDQEHPIRYCKSSYEFGRWLVDDLDSPRPELADLRADLVVCSDVIEHVADPDVLLNYLRRRSAPGGQIVISTPDRTRLHGEGTMAAGNVDHVREWNFGEFRDYLIDRGFAIEDHFHAAPVKAGLHLPFLRTWLRQMRKGRRYKFNQVCVVTPLAV